MLAWQRTTRPNGSLQHLGLGKWQQYTFHHAGDGDFDWDDDGRNPRLLDRSNFVYVVV